MTLLTDINTLPSDITLADGTKTNQWAAHEIIEDYKDQMVYATVELGPFADNGDGTFTPYRSRREVLWVGQEYLDIKDTWDNAAMIEKMTEVLSRPKNTKADVQAAIDSIINQPIVVPSAVEPLVADASAAPVLATAEPVIIPGPAV